MESSIFSWVLKIMTEYIKWPRTNNISSSNLCGLDKSELNFSAQIMFFTNIYHLNAPHDNFFYIKFPLETTFTHLLYKQMPPEIQWNIFTVKDKLPLYDIAKLADYFIASLQLQIKLSQTLLKDGIPKSRCSYFTACPGPQKIEGPIRRAHPQAPCSCPIAHPLPSRHIDTLDQVAGLYAPLASVIAMTDSGTMPRSIHLSAAFRMQFWITTAVVNGAYRPPRYLEAILSIWSTLK